MKKVNNYALYYKFVGAAPQGQQLDLFDNTDQWLGALHYHSDLMDLKEAEDAWIKNLGRDDVICEIKGKFTKKENGEWLLTHLR